MIRNLSPREAEVYRLRSGGTSIADVAAKLGLSRGQVSSEFSHAKAALGQPRRPYTRRSATPLELTDADEQAIKLRIAEEIRTGIRCGARMGHAGVCYLLKPCHDHRY